MDRRDVAGRDDSLSGESGLGSVRALGRETAHQRRTHRERVGMHRGGLMGTSAATAPAPQHMRALAQANRVRLARAELKRQVADGEASVADIVLARPWEAESMAIADLLVSQHRWGRERCRRFLSSIRMSETKTIGSMTERQRNELALKLSGEPDPSHALVA